MIFVLMLQSGCVNNIGKESSARTFYESLDLSSPESAVKTFTDAFQKEDYYTVFLIFSPSSQQAISNSINILNYDKLIKLDDYSEAKNILADTPHFQLVEDWEHINSLYFFDSIMLAAKEQSALLIDLSGGISILRSESISDSSQVDVHANVEGIEGNVVFRMEQSPSGRWRVHQVIAPGGDEELIPWSVSGE